MLLTVRGAVAAALMISAALWSGCKSSSPDSAARPGGAGADAAKATATPPAKVAADGVIASGAGVEKEKPAAGKGNVQGKAFYNGRGAAGVEVKLCQTFSRFLSGCGGETFTAKTDDAGEYLIKDVPPGVYEALTVRVFDTPYYVFATSGIVQSAKYKIEEGQTFFAPDTNLFKQDLKIQSPKAGAKIGADKIEVKWDAYPDAAYYKFSLFADSASGAKTEYDYINRRVDGAASYVLDKPLSPGSYTCKVEAYNASDVKLSQSSDDIKFDVTGGAAK